ncbi:MAG: GNAT family N-acetyltransferase [Deinococcaceae bacterium]
MSTFFRERRSKVGHKGKVVAVYVAHTDRNQGVARKLMETLIGRVRNYEGVEQIQLTVTQTQVAARKLYESLGFQLLAIERKALKLTDGYLDEEWWVLHP